MIWTVTYLFFFINVRLPSAGNSENCPYKRSEKQPFLTNSF